MEETKRHVIEDIRASDLPDRVRGDIAPDAHVTVTVEQLRHPTQRRRISDYWAGGRGLYESPEDVLAELRALRDAD